MKHTDYITRLNADHRTSVKKEISARKLYLSYPTFALQNMPEIEFDIKNSIAEFFQVSIADIQFAGSAQTGYSFHKQKPFEAGKSDLDVAIVNTELFTKYLALIQSTTEGYTNLTGFSIAKSDPLEYLKQSVIKGFLLMDLLPNGPEKQLFVKFISSLSARYFKTFKDINCALYLSTSFFERKQAVALKSYLGV